MRLFSKKVLFTAVIAVMGFMVANNASAQANLSGNVVEDSTQQAVADVEVRIDELDVTARTDSDGRFEFEFLQPGTHTVSVNAEGYEHWSQEVEILDEPKEMEIRLKKSEEPKEEEN